MSKYKKVHTIRIHTEFISEQFDRLTAIGPIFKVGYAGMQVCICSCGNVGVYHRANLLGNRTRSCGCLNDLMRRTNNTVHGHAARGRLSSEYLSYNSMKNRCYNQKNNRYNTYGGRGIKVCQRWLGRRGFHNFLQDMGLKPGKNYSIDRIDIDGDYCPQNCRWTTNAEQATNKTNTIWITAFEKTATCSQWAKETGISTATLRKRVRLGWSPEDVVSKRITKRSKNASGS